MKQATDAKTGTCDKPRRAFGKLRRTNPFEVFEKMAEFEPETPVSEAYADSYTFHLPAEQARNVPGTRAVQSRNGTRSRRFKKPIDSPVESNQDVFRVCILATDNLEWGAD